VASAALTRESCIDVKRNRHPPAGIGNDFRTQASTEKSELQSRDKHVLAGSGHDANGHAHAYPTANDDQLDLD
jgi:hypothetical protein